MILTFFNIIVVTIFFFSAYAIRKNYSNIRWKKILTDNLFRWIFALILAVGGAYILHYVPEIKDLIGKSGLLVGILSAGTLGLAIAGILISVLPSDTGLSQKST